MDMRDKIAQIVSSGAKWRDKGEFVLADAIIAALPDKIAPLEWQPIATAKKDRTGILVYDEDNEWQAKAWWDGDAWVCPHAVLSPTHWMPCLPDPRPDKD